MTSAGRPRPFPLRFVGAFVARPRLLGSLGAGVLLFVGLTLAHELRWITRAILSWDTAVVLFIGMLLTLMLKKDPDDIRSHAASQDEGQGVILGLAVIAAVASTAAVASELAVAKQAHGLEAVARVLLGFSTVAASWAFVQFIFALHYAHEYYAPDFKNCDPQQGGLNFPGDEDPDYWDFLHFAMIIGVANQTADISFTSKQLRRIGTVHGVFAFVFNTGVLALTINMVAGLFT